MNIENFNKDPRINDEAVYLKELFRKLEETNVCEENTDDEPGRGTRLQREIQSRLVETIDYLEAREEFWKYIN